MNEVSLFSNYMDTIIVDIDFVNYQSSYYGKAITQGINDGILHQWQSIHNNHEVFDVYSELENFETEKAIQTIVYESYVLTDSLPDSRIQFEII